MLRDVAPPTPGPALWDAVRDLPLRIDAVAREPLEQETPTFTRRTTVIRLSGDGHDGVGEDVNYDPLEHPRFQSWAGLLDLRGTWTLASFAAALDEGPLAPEAFPHAVDANYRRWAFESAALDLALRQAGTDLGAAVGRKLQPLSFVTSRGVGDPPTPEGIGAIRRNSPGLRFKLDLGGEWSADAIAAVAATDAVAVVDLKGWYVGTTVDTPADPETYRRVLEGLPDSYVEDAGITPETEELLRPHADRLTWDLPLQSASDLATLPFAPPRVVNVKPSRIGTLAELSAVYDACRAGGIGAYAGGQYELGPGRGQAQLLAALFHPGGPNDLAPGVFNRTELPDELPRSPLDLTADAIGFRLSADS
jgi:hypothetical protein